MKEIVKERIKKREPWRSSESFSKCFSYRPNGSSNNTLNISVDPIHDGGCIFSKENLRKDFLLSLRCQSCEKMNFWNKISLFFSPSVGYKITFEYFGGSASRRMIRAIGNLKPWRSVLSSVYFRLISKS
jgi:hypothetical protein